MHSSDYLKSAQNYNAYWSALAAQALKSIAEPEKTESTGGIDVKYLSTNKIEIPVMLLDLLLALVSQTEIIATATSVEPWTEEKRAVRGHLQTLHQVFAALPYFTTTNSETGQQRTPNNADRIMAMLARFNGQWPG